MQEKIKEIMDIMSKIEYGFKDENNLNIIDNNSERWEKHFNDFYYLQTPSELLKSECGVCWDQVELERELFQKVNINTKTYFIFIQDGNMLPSHTFLTYELDNKIFWFEHSWNKYKGIHEYSTEKELLKDVINKFKEDYSNFEEFYLYEYGKPPLHIKCNDFYQYIETQKQIIVD